jgi:hypothetical protein
MKEYPNNDWENEGGAYIHEPTNGDEPNPEAIHGKEDGWDQSGPVQTILLMRLYDIMLALLREQNPGLASSIHEAHSRGLILGPMPSFTIPDEGAGSD